MPIEQQRFFAVMRTVEVKVSLKYTNSEYESFVDSGASTFQDLFLTLYFAQPAQTVIPMLKVSGLQLVKVLLLKGENLSLDASETYIENVADSDKQKGLVFKWECSSLVQAICDKNEG